MTLKQMALVRVLKLLASAAVVGLVIGLAQTYFGVQPVLLAILVLFTVYAGRQVYLIELDKLNTLEKLKNIK